MFRQSVKTLGVKNCITRYSLITPLSVEKKSFNKGEEDKLLLTGKLSGDREVIEISESSVNKCELLSLPWIIFCNIIL